MKIFVIECPVLELSKKFETLKKIQNARKKRKSRKGNTKYSFKWDEAGIQTIRTDDGKFQTIIAVPEDEVYLQGSN